MSRPDLKVVTLQETSLRDVPGQLRDLADRIEKGEYGPVECAAMTMEADEFHLFSWGDGPRTDQQALVMLHAGVNLIADRLRRKRK